jgi:hypothetical protein
MPSMTSIDFSLSLRPWPDAFDDSDCFLVGAFGEFDDHDEPTLLLPRAANFFGTNAPLLCRFILDMFPA